MTDICVKCETVDPDVPAGEHRCWTELDTALDASHKADAEAEEAWRERAVAVRASQYVEKARAQ